MCGIIGYTGQLESITILLEGLKALEYRGYDSAGISFFHNNQIQTVKTTGKVSELERNVTETHWQDLSSTCGIGHTRWATHGGVTDINSHPHTFGNVTLIHNGIIENYHQIELEFASMGKYPRSQTDSEIAAMLIDHLYQGNPTEAIKKAVKRLEGSYAFCILFHDQPDVIYSIRLGSPLVACHNSQGSFIASDLVALLPYSKDYFVLPEYHIAKLTKSEIIVTDFDGTIISPKMLHVNWDIRSAQKNGYPHFMLKEIYEQPTSLHSTLIPRLNQDFLPDLTMDHIPNRIFDSINRIIIVACGTAMHAGLVGKILMERLLRIPVTVELASEFRYQDPILCDNSLVITISQSGETADTLAALRLAKEKSSTTLSIVNVKGSSIARESDYVLYTHAGPEIAVASTKAYTAQLACLYLLTYHFALYKERVTIKECQEAMKNFSAILPAIQKTLELENEIKEISQNIIKTKDVFFIGRGLDYALSCEGSLKLKEISYIHSEAYAAGELKHGTLSLITDGVPVIALATQSHVYPKMISNIREVRARGARIIIISNGDFPMENSIYDYRISLPMVDDFLAPFTAAVTLQLLAYYTSLYLGIDMDQPRNLAKSVTVE